MNNAIYCFSVTDNTQRGAYAEYLVSVALGAEAATRKDWGPYDVLTPNGIRVEVKASAYIQDWKQSKLSKIIFGIPQTHKYDFDADAFNGGKLWQMAYFVEKPVLPSLPGIGNKLSPHKMRSSFAMGFLCHLDCTN